MVCLLLQYLISKQETKFYLGIGSCEVSYIFPKQFKLKIYLHQTNKHCQKSSSTQSIQYFNFAHYLVLDPSFRVCRVRYISNSNFAAAAGHAAQSRFAQGVAMCQTWTCVRPSSRQVAGPPNVLPQTPAGPCSISNAFAPEPGRSNAPRDSRPRLCSSPSKGTSH